MEASDKVDTHTNNLYSAEINKRYLGSIKPSSAPKASIHLHLSLNISIIMQNCCWRDHTKCSNVSIRNLVGK